MTQRCAIYARYSSENQRDASIEDQVRICRARAERESWRVSAVYPDHALSGSTALRPGYQALMSAMRGGEIDVVLTESLDRLSRDQEHIAGFFKQARFAGVRIVTLAEGDISELHVGLKGTMGALYLQGPRRQDPARPRGSGAPGAQRRRAVLRLPGHTRPGRARRRGGAWAARDRARRGGDRASGSSGTSPRASARSRSPPR